MAFPYDLDLKHTAGDRYSLSLTVDEAATGLAAELRVLDVGTLESTVDDDGAAAFDPDDVAEILNLDDGEYTISLIVDPYGARRRTYATGTITVVAQPVE